MLQRFARMEVDKINQSWPWKMLLLPWVCCLNHKLMQLLWLLFKIMHYLKQLANDDLLQVLVGITPYLDLKLQNFSSNYCEQYLLISISFQLAIIKTFDFYNSSKVDCKVSRFAWTSLSQICKHTVSLFTLTDFRIANTQWAHEHYNFQNIYLIISWIKLFVIIFFNSHFSYLILIILKLILLYAYVSNLENIGLPDNNIPGRYIESITRKLIIVMK